MRGDDMDATGGKYVCYPANSHLQLPFQYIGDLFVNMMVFG